MTTDERIKAARIKAHKAAADSIEGLTSPVDPDCPLCQAMSAATQSPEETGIYQCPTCPNTERFTGIDAKGYGGPEGCTCEDGEGPSNRVCTCETELRQDFTVPVTGQWYADRADARDFDAFTGGGVDSEIGAYTTILCRDCGATVWTCGVCNCYE